MNPAPHLVLIGPMGAGKSSLGRRIAQTLGLRFVDLDREIETRAGTEIPTIFACEGEAGFRRRERETLADVLAEKGCIVATGGGAVLDRDNRALMRQQGFVVYLQIDVDEQLARLAHDRSRPLLSGADRVEVLTRLASERGPLYPEVADLTFSPAGMSAPEAADSLIDLLDSHWQRPATPFTAQESS
jgi:shikimate kinase